MINCLILLLISYLALAFGVWKSKRIEPKYYQVRKKGLLLIGLALLFYLIVIFIGFLFNK